MSSSSRPHPCAVCTSMGTECRKGECVFAPHLPAERYYESFLLIGKYYPLNYLVETLKGNPAEEWTELVNNLESRAIQRTIFALNWEIEYSKGQIARLQQPHSQTQDSMSSLPKPQPPCAVCMSMGTECRPDCVFVPHFPVEHFYQKFLLISEGYSLDYVVKILQETSEDQWEALVSNFVAAVEFYKEYPTRDGAISKLRRDIDYLKSQIARLRQQE